MCAGFASMRTHCSSFATDTSLYRPQNQCYIRHVSVLQNEWKNGFITMHHKWSAACLEWRTPWGFHLNGILRQQKWCHYLINKRHHRCAGRKKWVQLQVWVSRCNLPKNQYWNLKLMSGKKNKTMLFQSSSAWSPIPLKHSVYQRTNAKHIKIIMHVMAAHRIGKFGWDGQFCSHPLVSWHQQLPGTDKFADENRQQIFLELFDGWWPVCKV